MKSAYVLIDARGPEIQHRSGITAPDPFIYLALDGEPPRVFFDAREYDVQKQKLDQLQNGVQIERLEPYVAKVTTTASDMLTATLLVILKEKKIDAVYISGSLPYAIATTLTAAGLKLAVHDYAAEREHKTTQEINHLIAAQRVNESAFVLAWQILADSKIQGENIIYRDTVLTSEVMKAVLRKHLLDQGYDCPDSIIVASGEQAARPHDEGSGPLLPNQCIVIDIFPRSEATGYFADMTRTFIKGTPSPNIKELFASVIKVQREIAKSLAVGDSCSQVHQKTVSLFKKLGHPTSPEKGFMHGTGHSLGLGLHEDPRLNSHSTRTIEPGMVFTVEPGLYYPGVGGVRIEDVVVVHPEGRIENITKFDQPLFIP